jgi:hypothetical protein
MLSPGKNLLQISIYSIRKKILISPYCSRGARIYALASLSLLVR